MISPRDEIWIDMMQFDARAADRLWERGARPEDAPEWYGDVSELIETATGPAEPHELVDEPVVVDDMHRTTLSRPIRRCHHGRTVGRVIAMKAAVATAATVFGVAAAAAAATTGIVATMASVVAPVIGVDLQSQDDPESTPPVTSAPGAVTGRPDGGIGDQLVTRAEAPPTAPTSPDAAPASVRVPPGHVATGPAAVDPAATKPDPTPAAKPTHPTKSPSAVIPPSKAAPRRDKPPAPGDAHGGADSGRGHQADGKAGGDHAADEAVAEPAGHPPPAHSHRPG